jgi:hypothetical protein
MAEIAAAMMRQKDSKQALRSMCSFYDLSAQNAKTIKKPCFPRFDG